jgi:cytoskeletal protein RodZ
VTGFVTRRLPSDTRLGGRLRSLREEEGYSLPALAQKLKIPQSHLEHIEAGRYAALPERAYVRQFIKSYARACSRDPLPYLRRLDSEMPPPHTHGPTASRKVRPLSLGDLHTPNLFRNIFLAVLAAGMFGYLATQIVKLRTPPALDLFSPPDGFVTTKSSLEVAGRTEPETAIFVNGAHTLADSSGLFRETIDLSRGLNILTITAQKPHGAAQTAYRKVILEEEKQPIVNQDAQNPK